MPGETRGTKGSARERIAHETWEFLVVSLFIAPFFLSFEAYRVYLEGHLEDLYLSFGMALINALLLSKIILIGELINLGSRRQDGPLLVSTLYKSAVFTLFYQFFHLLETSIQGLFHGESFLQAIDAEVFTHPGRLAVRMVVVFFAFIPFFALWECRRIIGEERFRDWFLGSRRHPA